MPADRESIDDANPRMRLIGSRLTEGVVTVMVAGDLDFGTADAFRCHIRALLQGDCGGRLELDLSDLQFCDIAGMRALQAVAEIGAETQHQVRITAGAPCLDLLLHLCRIPVLLGHTPGHDDPPESTS